MLTTPYDDLEIAIDTPTADEMRWVDRRLPSMGRQFPLEALAAGTEFTVSASQAVTGRMVAEQHGGSLTLRQYRYELGKGIDWPRGRAAA